MSALDALPSWAAFMLLGGPPDPGPTGRLALALDLRWRPESLFVILNTYIDETGTHGDSSEYVLIAGWVGSLFRWRRMDARWSRRLKKDDLDHFHGKDCYHSKDPWTKENGWTRDRKKKLVSGLLAVPVEGAMFGFSVRLDNTDYRAWRDETEFKKRAIDSQYGLCFRYALELCVSVARGYRPRDKFEMNFILEEGHKNFPDAVRIFHEAKKTLPTIGSHLGTITPGEKKRFPGLQAADLVAYSFFRDKRDERFKNMPYGATKKEAAAAYGGKAPFYREWVRPANIRNYRERWISEEERRRRFGERAKRPRKED